MRRPPWLTDAHITQIRQIISTPREGSGPLLPGRHTVAEALGWTPYKAEVALRYLRSLEATEPPVLREDSPPPPPQPQTIGVSLPEPRAPRRDDWPRIPAPALILSDLHVPSHDPAWIKHCVERAIGLNVRRLVIAGDLLDFGHLSKWGQERDWTTEDEVQDARLLVMWLRQYFESIHIFPGNHDARLSRMLNRELSSRIVLEWITGANEAPNVAIHWHHHAYVGERWIVAHPRNYSRLPAKPALELAMNLRRHVAIGHTHKFALSRTPDGHHWAVEIGMCADAARMAYKQQELSTHPKSSLGGLIIDATERPILLHPELG